MHTLRFVAENYKDSDMDPTVRRSVADLERASQILERNHKDKRAKYFIGEYAWTYLIDRCMVIERMHGRFSNNYIEFIAPDYPSLEFLAKSFFPSYSPDHKDSKDSAQL